MKTKRKKSKPIKAPTVAIKKIPLSEGRKALGYYYAEDHHIEIERDQTDKEFLSTAIHELLHAMAPLWGENKVLRVEKIMADAIWKLGYRSHRRKR